MEVEYRRDANHSFLIVKNEDEVKKDYNVNMLINNKIPGMLETKIRSFNNVQEFHYDISSKVAIKSFYGQNKMREREIREFIFGLSRIADSVKEYLLDINDICLDYELIFINPETGVPEFCYYPGLQREFFRDLKKLLQKMLAVVDYENRQAVELAYGMQQIIINDNYTIEELLRFVNSNINEDESKYENNGNKMSKEDKYLFEEELGEYFPTLLENKEKKDTYKENSLINKSDSAVKVEKNIETIKKRKYNKKGILHFLKTGFLKKDNLMTIEQLNEKNEKNLFHDNIE